MRLQQIVLFIVGKFPKTLYQNDQILCLTSEHYQYVGIAGFVLIATYPFISFLYPNIQTNNRALDFKYDPTFLVIAIQMKLLVAGFASFFVRESVQLIMLLGSAIVLLLLAILTNKMQPCYYARFNSIEMGLYLMASWMHVCGAIQKFSSQGWLALGVGGLVILMITAAFYFQAQQIQQYMESQENKKQTIKEDDASDDKKAKLEFQFWKGLCDLEERYTTWLPEKMAERAEAKAAALKAEMEKLQAMNLEEEF